MTYSEFLKRLNGKQARAWMLDKRYGVTWQTFAAEHDIVATTQELALPEPGLQQYRRQDGHMPGGGQYVQEYDKDGNKRRD